MTLEGCDPFREPTDDEMATLDIPDELLDDDALTVLNRLDALDPDLDGDEIDALILDIVDDLAALILAADADAEEGAS